MIMMNFETLLLVREHSIGQLTTTQKKHRVVLGPWKASTKCFTELNSGQNNTDLTTNTAKSIQLYSNVAYRYFENECSLTL